MLAEKHGVTNMAKTRTESAAETTKQIVALSTGMIGLTITFAQKFQAGIGLLKFSWVPFGIAAALAVWTQMSITGEDNDASKNNRIPDADRPSMYTRVRDGRGFHSCDGTRNRSRILPAVIGLPSHRDHSPVELSR
ncbi:hypothetical protein E0H47_10150 [Rhizobium leguminosarum bv. viciae]|uniref:hypothetical protein n=1 Tax=Rhizobium leguminosarum TaxID=384 RepID=UPI00103EBC69|nr:hypothetical protein [Rhizobium leguminosarum]TBZ41642.1 hypothetical protein E0H47_10150 [Rhizobium leguminosarum bv. viciae]